MQWENPPKIEWQTTLLQEKHRSCILWFSMQSLRWGCAPPSPQTCQKGPATSPGRPLQTAGFSPQGSRPADACGAGPAGPLPAQTYPTGIPRSIGCNCLPSSAAASAAPVRESSAARLVGFFRGLSCPKGTK